jgi:ATP-dependent Clp protease protease subunit
MLHRLIMTIAVVSLAWLMVPVAMADTAPDASVVKKVPLQKMPEEMRDKLIEKIKQSDKISDEVKQKLIEAVEESGNDKSEDSDEDKEKKADDKDEKKEKKKPAEPSMSDRVTKLREEIQEMDTQFSFKVAKYKQELEEQRLKIEKNKLDRQIEDAVRAEESRALKLILDELKLRQQLIEAEAKLAITEQASKLRNLGANRAMIEAKLASRATDEKLGNVVLTEKQYTDKPFSKGVLTISDRRIELNGPIMFGAAKHVAERIHYYNNQSDKPIFLVIDSSPGGSGMEGFHILQAMKNSQAPVHVVVKRFAASMAAIITTLADESYAYPNAIILHHQGSSFVSGNTTMQKEQLERFKEMSARLVGEVAKKIGITEEQFVKRMYSNRSTGDWDLFADKAVKQRWVGHVVNEIRETAIRTRPVKKTIRPMIFAPRMHNTAAAPEVAVSPAMERYEVKLEEQVDDQGHRFVRLPRLSPMDHWFLHNPDQYYR